MFTNAIIELKNKKRRINSALSAVEDFDYLERLFNKYGFEPFYCNKAEGSSYYEGPNPQRLKPFIKNGFIQTKRVVYYNMSGNKIFTDLSQVPSVDGYLKTEYFFTKDIDQIKNELNTFISWVLKG